MTSTATTTTSTEYLTRDQVCERLNISRRILWQWERDKIGPPFVRIGGTVRYPRQHFEQFMVNAVCT